MTFIDTLKGGVNTAVEAISNVAQTLFEKQRAAARLNRLRSVMKSESELMNRAYIALGKSLYEQLKKGEKPSAEREEKLMELIDNCKAKIAKARNRYREIVESRNEFLFQSAADTEEEPYEKKDVVDITVACSNENEYTSSPFEQSAEPEAAPAEAVPEDNESPAEELF